MVTQQDSASNSHGHPHYWAAMNVGDLKARDALIREHLPLVHMVARQLTKALSEGVEFGELVSSGSLGLMAAIDNFDSSMGLSFSTFAVPRIRGAMFDDLRKGDRVPRSIRRKERIIARSRSALESILGRAPNHKELSIQIGIELEELWKWELAIETSVEVSIEAPVDTSNSRFGGDEFVDRTVLTSSDDEPDNILNIEQEKELLSKAMMKLSTQEREVLTLYFYEELNLLEIAGIFQITESRASQVKDRACSKLRILLDPTGSISNDNNKSTSDSRQVGETNLAWKTLIQSGALEEEDDLSSLMRSDE